MVEGLPITDTNTPAAAQPVTQPAPAAPTPDEAVNNTVATPSGSVTQPQENEAQPKEKTFTQTEVNRMFDTRLKSAVKAELRKLTGEQEGGPTVEDLQRQLSESNGRIRSFEAREEVESYLNDGRNKLNVRADNIRGIQEIVIPRLKYDDSGKPENLKEAVESAKLIAPALFANQSSNINAGAGLGTNTAPANMNDIIRQKAGRLN